MNKTKNAAATQPKAAHTPGLWIVDANRDSGSSLRVGSANDRQASGYVARVYGANPDVTEANARLIAAAPELLAIAQRLSALCPSKEGLGGHAPIAAFIQLGEAARAAIAKAKGQS